VWVMWNLVSVRLETVLVSVQYRCRFALNVPSAQKSFWMHLMILLDDEARVEACLSLSGDSANFDARWVCGLCQTYHRLGNGLERTRWKS
jgi:hypothetical protein